MGKRRSNKKDNKYSNATRIANKKRKLEKHLKIHPNEKNAIEALNKLLK